MGSGWKPCCVGRVLEALVESEGSGTDRPRILAENCAEICVSPDLLARTAILREIVSARSLEVCCRHEQRNSSCPGQQRLFKVSLGNSKWLLQEFDRCIWYWWMIGDKRHRCLPGTCHPAPRRARGNYQPIIRSKDLKADMWRMLRCIVHSDGVA